MEISSILLVSKKESRKFFSEFWKVLRSMSLKKFWERQMEEIIIFGIIKLSKIGSNNYLFLYYFVRAINFGLKIN